MSEYLSRFESLKARNSERDKRMRDVALVCSGNADQLLKGVLPEGNWSKPIVANMIEVASRDLGEQIGVLPTITANGDSALEKNSRTNADKRTKIANYYLSSSRMGTNLIRGGQQFATYGFNVFRVEPHFKEKRIHISVENSFGAYYDMDRFGVVQVYARSYKRKAGDIAALFPEYADQIMTTKHGGREESGTMLELVRWMDRKETVLFLADRNGLVLESIPNPIDEVPVTVAERTSLDGVPRGQFDDVLPVYAAKARMAVLTLSAVQKSVDAPLALPSDVTQLSVGGDQVIRSNSPEKIRRVPLDAPPAAFAQGQALTDELRLGARFPQARSGDMDNSIVTGQGVKALMSGFDNQVKTAQSILGEALGRAVSIALKMDEAVFGDMPREVSAEANGVQYKLKYRASADIRGNYGVTVEYGIMAGMDPNRSLVWALQARGDKLISRSLVRRNLPISINASEEERAIDIEEMRDSMMQAVSSIASAIPQMASQGQDPTKIITSLATVISERKKGTEIEDAVALAFKPEPPPPAPEQQGLPAATDMGAAGMMGGGEAPMGGQTSSAQMPQGAPPSMQSLLSGLMGQGMPGLPA